MLALKPEAFPLAEAVAHPVILCGRQLIADNSGALYWPRLDTLLVADLHLGAGPAPAWNGTACEAAQARPGARETLTRLAEVMDRYEPARVIALGEHHAAAAQGIAEEILEILGILQEYRAWIWVAGDARPPCMPNLGGSVCSSLELSGLTLRTRPAPGLWVTHEISAHLQPAANLCFYGYSMRRACFVGNGRRLVMPAFGAPLSGRNVLDDAFRPLFGTGGMAVWMLGHEALYPVATRFLIAD